MTPDHLDDSKWQQERRYSNNRVMVVLTHEDGTQVCGTWWRIDDGSAEEEAAKQLELWQRETARQLGLPDPFAARDAAIARRVQEHMWAAESKRMAPKQYKPPRPRYTPPSPVVEPPSAVRDWDGPDCCSCHLSAPCNFCTTLTEEEYDAYAADGLNGLRTLWDAWDDQQEEEG